MINFEQLQRALVLEEAFRRFLSVYEHVFDRDPQAEGWDIVRRRFVEFVDGFKVDY